MTACIVLAIIGRANAGSPKPGSGFSYHLLSQHQRLVSGLHISYKTLVVERSLFLFCSTRQSLVKFQEQPDKSYSMLWQQMIGKGRIRLWATCASPSNYGENYSNLVYLK